jgi:gamma-glutamyltranspeptidase/glutathione hydrolase
MKILRRMGIGLLAMVTLLAIVYAALPKGPRDPMEFKDPHQVRRKSVTAERFMASTGTPWSTRAALDIMRSGGNAFDAAMAALLALNVTYPEAASFPSVAPTLLYHAREKRVLSYCGVGTAPAKATIDFFRSEGHDTIPKMGILAQLLPSSPDAIIAILDRFGTRSFGEIAQTAIHLAETGFPTHAMMLKHLDLNLVERMGFAFLMPYNVEVYMRGQWWRPLHHKDRFLQRDLAQTLKSMAAAEKKVLENGGSRSEGLKAVRDYFYKGPIAKAIVQLHQSKNGLISREDLANYTGYWEEPLSGSYGDYTFHAHRTWSQGAVVPMVLQLLEGMDLKAMGHNSPEYVHTLLQAIELAMADREAYFGDPDFIDVPVGDLLSKEFAASRRRAMTPGKAFGKMPDAGVPFDYQDGGMATPVAIASAVPSGFGRQNTFSLFNDLDTSYLAVTDAQGNSVSLTPSDFPQSPMVPGTGLCLGIRMTQFRLDPDHPAALQPGKRPRLTPNASMVTRDGELYMTFGTPEGDQQPQALVQVFLNLTVFGMDIQDAIEAPRFRSRNFPDSFSPHTYRPGVVQLEKNLFDKVARDLGAMGYNVEEVEDLHHQMGAVGAILRQAATGKLIGGADPRQENWAEGE